MKAEIKQIDGIYHVTLDGHKIDNVKSVEIQMHRDEKPLLVMYVYADDIYMSKTERT